MDNENYTRRPRKRVTKKMAQRRRITALAIILLIIILGIILIAKACSGSSKDSGDNKKQKLSVTTTTTITNITTTTPLTTTTLPAVTADPNDPETITGLTLDKYSVYIEVGGTDMPWVTMTPSSSTKKGEIWKSSDEAVATVDQYGHIKGIAAGECIVTVTSENNPLIYAEVKVNVASPNDEPNNAAGQTATSAVHSSTPSPSANEPTYIGGVLIANKSYGLPESYAPGLDSTAKSQFDLLSEAAAKEGLNIYLSSGYRSYSYQKQIYQNYADIYGSETADTFSVRPGYSEHQTGLAIDVNTIDDSFAGTPEAKWLAEHAHEFGFIIRYPADKVDITGYKYEPWHIRYLGVDKATEVYNSGLRLEEFLGIDSKYKD